ncbi:N(6) adenine specific DNA methyltransferase [Trichuris trichiura]|uniref:Protein-lysine N-methyltransferase TTRE_0000433501 n=1 Tax=Trichuris trichiura TaxID=36087 RepID=A0A077Z771_TRITR|nr:N(6) adenine specific DNA methyltransferase [Trichuris trichiura]
MSDSDDCTLSESARQALQEFLAEQALANVDGQSSVEENWQLSQFWYNDQTSERLAMECLSAIESKDCGLIGCLCCPSVYDKIMEIDPKRGTYAWLFEFDRRFAAQNRQFVFYDYRSPVDLPATYKASCSVVIADPPFLSEECLLKVITTAKFLTTERIIFCTGVSMEKILTSHLKVQRCRFLPQHHRKLANEFRCYANYPTIYLDDEKEE